MITGSTLAPAPIDLVTLGDSAPQSNAVPLVVDLDGTLTPTDTLVEMVLRLVKESPVVLLLLPLWLFRGIAHFKYQVARRASFSAASLPYRAELLDYLCRQKAGGRRLILATAAHQSIATAVADHLGLFDQVLASSVDQNLKGERKLAAIHQQVGADFSYAGDSIADLPIWRAARAAVLVGVSPTVSRIVAQNTTIELELPRQRPGLKIWVKGLRLHQWLKNLLVLVPLLTAFSFLNTRSVLIAAMAFFAFSFAASATYVVNDLLDLDSDRVHPRKRARAFACCAINIVDGFLMAFVLMVAAFAVAIFVGKAFTAVLLAYVVSTTFYTLRLKEYVLIDVLTLAVLYTMRIVAGSVAIGVSMSSWLLAFSVFIFLSLALVKRCSELVSLNMAGRSAAKGRDYRISDLVILWPLGVSSAISAVVIFGLFINASVTQERYATPEVLWMVALGLIYWLTRLWIKTARGEMHDDPIIYAIKNRGSRITVVWIVIAMLLGHSVHIFQS